MSSGFEVSAAAGVGSQSLSFDAQADTQENKSASLSFGAGIGDLSTKLEVKVGLRSESSDNNPEASTSESSAKSEKVPEAPTDETSERTDETPEAPSGETSERTDETPEAPSGETSERTDETPEAPSGETSERTDETPEAPTDETSERTEETPEAPSGETSERTEETPEAQTDETSERTEETPEAQTDETSERTEETPEAQTEESFEKPGSPRDRSEQTKPEAPRNESSEKAKPEAPRNESSEKARPKPKSDGAEKAPDSSGDSAHEDSTHRSGRGFRIFGVEFAPLNTPMRRRLQTLAVMQWLLSLTIMPVVCVLFILMTLFTPLAPLSLAYIGWVLIFDRNTSQRGGRRWDRVRRWSLWRHYRDYFPIRLVKSADLDPAHNYLIGYHPHGIISCGAFCNFGTEATGFSAKFPGIKPYLLTLRMNFFWPLLRGYYLAAGLCDVSRSSLRWILGREGGGNAAIIVVGGAQEALDARPGNYKLTLLRRKGFARMALQTGAHLVPCFSFGENDLFRQAANPPGSWVRTFQQLFKGAFSSSPPLFYGRGVFNYTFGLLPFRHPVTTVVGAPIPVQRSADPSPEQVDQLHRLYMDRLADLFDEHKAEQGVPEDVRLEFV